MPELTRRNFLIASTAATVGTAFGFQQVAAQSAPRSRVEDFDFLFFTDTHLQPELDAAHGCDMAFKRMRTIKADFAIQGGDHVYDALAVPRARSLSLFEMYDKTQQDLSLPVYHAIGNHDVFGLDPRSGVETTDADYGKKYFRDHIGKTYYSFDRKGIHFIVLDSIGITTDRNYEGRVDAEQIDWLRADLGGLPAGAPVIVTTHIPLVTSINQYLPPPVDPPKRNGMTVNNSAEVIRLFEGHNVLGVLQGHTHVNERVEWHSVPYLTGGAVCGNWWHGTRLGTPEGFTVVSMRGGKLSTRYETYGFKSVEPKDT